jgi:hypothetical protein
MDFYDLVYRELDSDPSILKLGLKLRNLFWGFSFPTWVATNGSEALFFHVSILQILFPNLCPMRRTLNLGGGQTAVLILYNILLYLLNKTNILLQFIKIQIKNITLYEKQFRKNIFFFFNTTFRLLNLIISKNLTALLLTNDVSNEVINIKELLASNVYFLWLKLKLFKASKSQCLF